MGSSAQQLTNAMAITKHIELGVRSGKIFAPIEKKSFEGKKKEVDYVKSGYRGKKKQFQKYNTRSPSFQITNINSTIHTPLEYLSPKITKTRTKLKVSKRRTTKESRNNYLDYRYLKMKCTRSY
jgi:hypothetical protein